MLNDVPTNYYDMTQKLYEFNETIYSLEGIGILFVVLRSLRFISNIILQQLLPFKLIVLYKPIMLNLYYFCGMILVAYLRFGTNETQIPYDESDSTNGKYYYLFGQNSNVVVDNQYYLNGNYTSVLIHDSDFTLLILILLLLGCIPYFFTKKWPKLIKEITILFIEGSIFEITFSSTGQISQTIYNNSQEIIDIVYSVLSGILLIFYLIIIIRPLLLFQINQQKCFLNIFIRKLIKDKIDPIICFHYFLILFNEFFVALMPSFVTQFEIIFYTQIGIAGLQSVLLFLIIIKQKQILNVKIYFISLLISNLILIAIYIICFFNDYLYGFIGIILLSIYFLIGLFSQIFCFILCYKIKLCKIEQQSQSQLPTEQQAIINQQTNVNIELQSVTLQFDQSNLHNNNQIQQPQSKFMLNSQISNIFANRQQQISQFQSQNTSSEILKEVDLQNQSLVLNNYISKRYSYEYSQLFDNGYLNLEKIMFQFKFKIKVINNSHEIDPKILKRNNIGNKIEGRYQFTIYCNDDCNIEEMQIKTYYSGQLLSRDIKLTKKILILSQQIEINHDHNFEQSDTWNEKIVIKLIIDGKINRISLCNNALKLITISSLYEKSIMKLIKNGSQKINLLFESRIEKFDFSKVIQYCSHYQLYQYKQNSGEYRNQELSTYFGKIQLILPGLPYIRLILSIEQLINIENIKTPKLIDPNVDFKRIQYIIVSIFSKITSTQLAYGHKQTCEQFGHQLINYFSY